MKQCMIIVLSIPFFFFLLIKLFTLIEIATRNEIALRERNL